MMEFLAFPVLVWVMLSCLAYAGWMLRDAWKQGRTQAEPAAEPRVGRRLFATRELALQVVTALAVCVVVGYAMHSIFRAESFRNARVQTISWLTMRNPTERPNEELGGKTPDWLVRHVDFRSGRPVSVVNVGALPITNEDLDWIVRENPDVESLVLSQTRLTDDGLAHLATLTNLRDLTLNGCRISNAGVAHLRSLPNLRSLDLCDTQVSDAGLASLASIHGLRELDLSGTPITDAGLRQLKRLPELRTVNLDNTAVKPEARAEFRNP